jgi:hypothetical protein
MENNFWTKHAKGGYTLVTLQLTVMHVTDATRNYDLKFHPMRNGITVSCKPYTMGFPVCYRNQMHHECKKGDRSGRWWRVTLHIQDCSGCNHMIPPMRCPNTDSTPNMPVTLPRTNFWYVTLSRVPSSLSRYGITVYGNVTIVCPPWQDRANKRPKACQINSSFVESASSRCLLPSSKNTERSWWIWFCYCIITLHHKFKHWLLMKQHFHNSFSGDDNKNNTCSANTRNTLDAVSIFTVIMSERHLLKMCNTKYKVYLRYALSCIKTFVSATSQYSRLPAVGDCLKQDSYIGTYLWQKHLPNLVLFFGQ